MPFQPNSVISSTTIYNTLFSIGLPIQFSVSFYPRILLSSWSQLNFKILLEHLTWCLLSSLRNFSMKYENNFATCIVLASCNVFSHFHLDYSIHLLVSYNLVSILFYVIIFLSILIIHTTDIVKLHEASDSTSRSIHY